MAEAAEQFFDEAVRLKIPFHKILFLQFIQIYIADVLRNQSFWEDVFVFVYLVFIKLTWQTLVFNAFVNA